MREQGKLSQVSAADSFGHRSSGMVQRGFAAICHKTWAGIRRSEMAKTVPDDLDENGSRCHMGELARADSPRTFTSLGTMDRTARYPHHLARLVAARMRGEQGQAPSTLVLTRLLETLYFASLKRNEGRPIVCTVNYASPDLTDAQSGQQMSPESESADRWRHVRFLKPLPFDVRTLTSLAKGADPAAISLNVYHGRSHKLFIWGMVDQEVRHGENLAIDGQGTVHRPSRLYAAIVGVGKLSVWVDGSLVGSLTHDALVEEYYDTLWSGPVHDLLRSYLAAVVAETDTGHGELELCPQEEALDAEIIECECMVRWLHGICRILIAMQDYKTGGGLLLTPEGSRAGLHVKYAIHYDRFPQAILGFVTSGQLVGQLDEEIQRQHRASGTDQDLAELHGRASRARSQRDEYRNAALGAIRFIASLSCVDGFVLLDPTMTVHGFGVEVRSDARLDDVYVAGDSQGDESKLRQAELGLFGTRHRAMMRYCYQNPGSLGFVVSQDGEIRVMTTLGGRLVVWENLDLELTLRTEQQLTRRDRVTRKISTTISKAG